jgi:hypothetical protein
VEVSGVEVVLRALRPQHEGVDTDLGIRKGAAFLRMRRTAAPERWAVVWTPGDRWFALDVDGGFSLNRFDEEITDGELQQLLERYVDVGLAYVLGDMAPTSAGLFRARVLRGTTDDGHFDLTQSVAAAVKDAFRVGRSRR